MSRYNVKVVKGDRHVVYPCDYYEVTEVREDCFAAKENLAIVGRTFELREPNRVVRQPEDGERVHVMNNNGDTIANYWWPPKAAAKQEVA